MKLSHEGWAQPLRDTPPVTSQSPVTAGFFCQEWFEVVGASPGAHCCLIIDRGHTVIWQRRNRS